MISELFSFLDGVARFIGWGAILLGILWFLGKVLEEKRLQEEAQREQEEMFAFEAYLAGKNADRYNRYKDLKQRYAFEGDEVHWHQIALECGVPRMEIIKDRRKRVN